MNCRYVALLTLFAFILLGAARVGQALDFECKGRFLYTDKEYNHLGWTGNKPNLPVRDALVTIYRFNDFGIPVFVAKGGTDLNGNFTIPCSISSVATLFATVETISPDNNGGASGIRPLLQVRVTDFIAQPNSIGLATYALKSASVIKALDTTPVDFGTTISSQIIFDDMFQCDPFNIYDTLVASWELLASDLYKAKSQKKKQIVFNWPGAASYAQGLKGLIRVDDCYDDAVVAHELGHMVMRLYSDDDTPGGPHFFGDSDEDPRLALSEGWASYFAGMVMRSIGKPALYADYIPFAAAHLQVGGPNGNRVDLETGEPWNNGLTEIMRGAGDEFAVANALFDLSDVSTNVADDDFLNSTDIKIANQNVTRALWKVLTGPVKQAKDARASSFWEGWFDLYVKDGQDSSEFFKMKDIFDALWGIQFIADPIEPNNNVNSATSLVANDQWNGPFSLYKKIGIPYAPGQGDKDLFSVQLSVGQAVVIETTGPADEFDQYNDPNSGSSQLILDESACHTQGDTFMRVFKPNGNVFMSNDDSAGECRSSGIGIVSVPVSGNWIVEISTSNKKPGWSMRDYGSYRIKATILQ